MHPHQFRHAWAHDHRLKRHEHHRSQAARRLEVGCDGEPLRGRRASGTTLTLRIVLDPGTALSRVAHALSWPCMPTRRRALALGWSGRDVAERMAQLGWAIAEPGDERGAITVLGKQLLALADKVANCVLADGRRADVVFPLWPPWLDHDAGETRDQRAERRNRCVADVMWRAGAVTVDLVDGA